MEMILIFGPFSLEQRGVRFLGGEFSEPVLISELGNLAGNFRAI
jgi:hypothetical protein